MDIKFRAWDIEAEHMDIIDDLYWFEESGVHKIEGGSAAGHFSEYKIMLSTGLKDSKGKLIYEGDIVQFLKWKPKEIVYQDKAFAGFTLKGTDLFLTTYDAEEMTVLGNKFENPELLEDTP